MHQQRPFACTGWLMRVRAGSIATGCVRVPLRCLDAADTASCAAMAGPEELCSWCREVGCGGQAVHKRAAHGSHFSAVHLSLSCSGDACPHTNGVNDTNLLTNKNSSSVATAQPAMIPSPADAWLQGSAMDQGSAGKGPGSAMLPPRAKPRQSSSPASSVDRDGAPSIGRSGVKGGGRTPRQASHLASLHCAGSSGGKFSFGKCMLSRGKSSPLSFARVGSQHAPSGAATPNLILGGAKPANNHQQQQQPLLPALQHQPDSDAKDTALAKDCDKAQAAGVQDLDLQRHTSGDAVDAAIRALTSEWQIPGQALACMGQPLQDIHAFSVIACDVLPCTAHAPAASCL